MPLYRFDGDKQEGNYTDSIKVTDINTVLRDVKRGETVELSTLQATDLQRYYHLPVSTDPVSASRHRRPLYISEAPVEGDTVVYRSNEWGTEPFGGGGGGGVATVSRGRPSLKFTSEDAPILIKTDFDIPTALYWPSIIRAEGRLPSPIAKYYCYLSTNHDVAEGGVWLAVADDLTGPWEAHDQDRIYVDTVSGTQTETPSIEWEPLTQQVYMYYQNAGAGRNQSTVMASSTDGVSFTRQGVVIDVPDPASGLLFPGDGHTGYARVTRISRNNWVAVTLDGGTDYAYRALHRSRDGIRWVTDPNSLLANQEAIADQERRVNVDDIFMVSGKPWGLATSPIANAGAGQKNGIVVAGPITDDLRHFDGPPEVVWEPTVSWESNDVQSAGIFVDDDGTIALAYVCGSTVGTNGHIGLALGEFS